MYRDLQRKKKDKKNKPAVLSDADGSSKEGR
jgi:hypothetical protein